MNEHLQVIHSADDRIYPGDHVRVDKDREPKPGDLVLVVRGFAYCVERYQAGPIVGVVVESRRYYA